MARLLQEDFINSSTVCPPNSLLHLTLCSVNEQPETQCDLIDLTKNFVITEKLDGSLISPFWTEGKLRFATKQGVTDTTILCEKFVSIPKLAF